MERLYQIGKVNIKHNLFPHLVIAVCLCILTPFLMGVNSLDNVNTAKVLEIYIANLGIIFLVPIFIPDQDKNIRELIESKYTSLLQIHIIRVIEAVVFLAIFLLFFVLYLYLGECRFPMFPYFLGTMAEAIFLGGMGVLVYGFFDNIATAYMIPFVFYMMNFGASSKLLHHFYLFSMSRGSYVEKRYLVIAGVLFIVIGISVREWKKQCV